MAYGREKGFQLGGPRRKGPGLKLQSDMQLRDHVGGKKPKKAARKRV